MLKYLRTLARVRSFLLFAPLALCTCTQDDGDPTTTSQPTEYVLDTSRYEPEEPRAPLRIANETLLIPLGAGSTAQELTREAPGDLIVSYTRRTCPVIEVDDVLTMEGTALPHGDEVRLLEVTIEELPEYGIVDDASTCFSLRIDGRWRDPLPASRVESADGKKVSTLTFDSEGVDGLAIFLATYTSVTEVRYQIVE